MKDDSINLMTNYPLTCILHNSHNNSSDIPNGYDDCIWIEVGLLVEVGILAVVGVVAEKVLAELTIRKRTIHISIFSILEKLQQV